MKPATLIVLAILLIASCVCCVLCCLPWVPGYADASVFAHVQDASRGDGDVVLFLSSPNQTTSDIGKESNNGSLYTLKRVTVTAGHVVEVTGQTPKGEQVTKRYNGPSAFFIKQISHKAEDAGPYVSMTAKLVQ